MKDSETAPEKYFFLAGFCLTAAISSHVFISKIVSKVNE